MVTYGLEETFFEDDLVTLICLVEVALTVVSIIDSEEVNSEVGDSSDFATTASWKAIERRVERAMSTREADFIMVAICQL